MKYFDVFFDVVWFGSVEVYDDVEKGFVFVFVFVDGYGLVFF